VLVVGKVQVTQPSWILTEGNGSLVAVALHDGHDIGAEVSPLLAVSESDRTREEDPFIAFFNWID
jgi:chemotaxis receptor (MCP) glutamine deamidase CheD